MLQVWTSDEAATAARQAFETSELGAEFTSLIGPDSVISECFAGLD